MSGIRSGLCISAFLGLAGLVACQPQTRSEASAQATVPYYNTPDFTPVWLSDPADVNRKITHRIADFSLRDQLGRVVSQETVAGKIYVANFFFTACPSICPRMTNWLKAVQDTFRLEPRVALLSFSVTPWIDSIPRLRRYADSKGIRPDTWLLLTGRQSTIYTLARRSYFAEETIGFTKDSTEFLHTEHLILVDQNRRIRGVYNGTQPQEIDKLVTDIQILLLP